MCCTFQSYGATKCYIKNLSFNKVIGAAAHDFEYINFKGKNNPDKFNGKTIKHNGTLVTSLILQDQEADGTYTLALEFDDDTMEVFRYDQKSCLENLSPNFVILQSSGFRTIDMYVHPDEYSVKIEIRDDNAQRIKFLMEKALRACMAGEYDDIKETMKQAMKYANRGRGRDALKKRISETRAFIFCKIGWDYQEAALRLEQQSSISQAYDETRKLLLKSKEYLEMAADAGNHSYEYINKLNCCNARIKGNEYFKQATTSLNEGREIWISKKDFRAAEKKCYVALQNLQYAQNQYGRYNDPIVKHGLEATIRQVEVVNHTILGIGSATT